MSETDPFLPPTPDEISAAIQQDGEARDTERHIQDAGREAAAAIPRRLFRTAARDNALRAEAYRTGVDAATHNKD